MTKFPELVSERSDNNSDSEFKWDKLYWGIGYIEDSPEFKIEKNDIR
jgi:hypothetical protein